MTTLSQQQGVQTIPTRRKLGDILTSAGVITEAQLQTALGHQRQWGGRLGHILIDLQVIDENRLAQTLAEQLGLPLVDLDAMSLTVDLARLVPQSLAERHGVFPVAFDTASGKLTVVFSDPTNLVAVDEVRFQTGKVVQVAVAGEGQIAAAIRRFYYGEDPSAVEPPVEPTTLFGNVNGFLAGDEELAELEPIEGAPEVGPEAAPASEAASGIAPGPVPSGAEGAEATDVGVLPLASDPLSGFLAEAEPPEPPGFGQAPDPASEALVANPFLSAPKAVAKPPAASAFAPKLAPQGSQGNATGGGASDLDAAFPADLAPAAESPAPAESILDQAVDLTRQTVVGNYNPLDFAAAEPTNPQIEMARFLFSQTQEPTRPNVPLADLLGKAKPEQPPPPILAADRRPSAVAALDQAGDRQRPGFSDDDLGQALEGLEAPRPTTGEWNGGMVDHGLPAEIATDSHFAQALARVLIRKGLIDEAELLAEIASAPGK